MATSINGHRSAHHHWLLQIHRLHPSPLSPASASFHLRLPTLPSGPPLVLRSRFSCCSRSSTATPTRTCKNCKKQYDPSLNHPSACRYHTAHFGGETKRKFESVHSGGTMSTPESGEVFQYWHCCGSEDPFDQGCTAAPHCSYDD